MCVRIRGTLACNNVAYSYFSSTSHCKIVNIKHIFISKSYLSEYNGVNITVGALSLTNTILIVFKGLDGRGRGEER